MENIKAIELFEIYQEVCEEAGLEWTVKGWDFFDKVMFKDYMNHCKNTNTEPCRKAFKRNCVYIAKDMMKEATRKAC